MQKITVKYNKLFTNKLNVNIKNKTKQYQFSALDAIQVVIISGSVSKGVTRTDSVKV